MKDPRAAVKAYDIRGVVPEVLDEEVAELLGRAAAVELAADALIVARDMRPTSEALAEAFMRGVRRQGTDTVAAGLASTDLLYFASGRLGLPGAMVTASHNPAHYNGIKLCRAGAGPIARETGLERIGQRAFAGDFPRAPRAGSRRDVDLLDAFAAHVRSFADPAGWRPLRIAVDAGNGMAGLVVPAVFADLPVDVVPLYFELDGTFPNHPADPLDPANLADTRAAVRRHGCDAGLAFDGDADRVFFVDEAGRPASPSVVTAAIADVLLQREPGATVLYNAVCSRVVPETVAAAGGSAVRTRVGHSYIKATMAETGAVFAGEHSGHFYFRDNFRADSGVIAALLVLEALGRSEGPLSSLLAPYDRYAASGEVNVAVGDTAAALDRVLTGFRAGNAVDHLDGLTIDGGDWWFNVRSSNTEPVLRLNVEARDRPCMERLRDRVLDIVGMKGSDGCLP